MKKTRYFENYQDAYNYYGGTEVPSNEIALVGNASYVFVSSDNSYGGGNTQYFDAGMTNDTIVVTLTENAYTSGSSYGYEQGYAYGYPLGYTEGTTYGESIGYTTGYSAGYSYGYDIGYDAGVVDGYDNATTPYNEQYLTLEAFDVYDKGMPGLEITNNGVDIYYKVDDGAWTSITSGSTATIGITEGTKVMLKGTNNTLWVDDGNDAYCGLVFLGSDASFKAYGNVMSLLEGDNFGVQFNTNYSDQFRMLFLDFVQLHHAKDIVLPTNGDSVDYAFSEMFAGTTLEDAPVICPAPSRSYVAQGTYSSMFDGCAELKYVVVVTSQAIATSAQGEVYDVFELGLFGDKVTPAYLVVNSAQEAHVKEAVEANSLDIMVLGYDSTEDEACYSTDAETFCLRMAAKYLPDESYEEGYDNGWADGEASVYDEMTTNGTAYITANTLTDVTAYAYAYCTAQGGGAAQVDADSSLVTYASKYIVENKAKEEWPPVQDSSGMVRGIYDCTDTSMAYFDVYYTVDMHVNIVDQLETSTNAMIVDKFDTTYNALAAVDSRDYTVNYYSMDAPNEGDPCRIEIMVQLNAGEKIGFSCGKLDIVEIGEPGDGAQDIACDTGVDWLTYNGSHWIEADQTGDYTFNFVDDENGGCIFSYIYGDGR